MAFSRSCSQDEAADAPWTERVSAQQALQGVIHSMDGHSEAPKRRKSSKLRLFTNSLPLLRRQGTGDTNATAGDTSDMPSSTVVTALAAHDQNDQVSDPKDLNEDSVMAYLAKNARNGDKFKSFMNHFTKHIPPPTDHDREVPGTCMSDSSLVLPTTLRAAVKLFPEVKLLTEDVQEITVAVDIEGVLHNRRPLADSAIDVVFLVDNSYYVTEACLEQSLQVVNGALSGTQVWDPPRPNPSMTDVILGIARALEVEHLKAGRTHIIVLSPAAHVLHDVSRWFPDLYLHRVNPAVLPYCREPELQHGPCADGCCHNVFASNWSKYQSTANRIKRIVQNARCARPVGELTRLSVDVRTRAGCELVDCHGSKEIPRLYLGQVHTLFVKVRVTKAEASNVNLDSHNPIFNSSVDGNGLRQELLNSVHVGATKVHVLDIQVLYHNSIHEAQTWNYTESPLILTSELGGLAPPKDTSLEVYKRQYFYDLSRVSCHEAKVAAQGMLDGLGAGNEEAKKLVERMAKEIECHVAIREYEKKCRQKLPLCPGPIEIETSHQWLIEIWSRRTSKCDCIDASERLG
ncbi:hypothetical protein ACJQWK_04071 [Exserohilum turcicum]